MLETECVICYAPLKENDLVVVTECNHRCCLKCGLRYKFISNRSGCPICLSEVKDEEMLFAVETNREGARFPKEKKDEKYLWGNCVLCETQEIEKIEEILSRSCSMCGEAFEANEQLVRHYHIRHRRYPCTLCMAYRCEFPLEYAIYDEFGLKKHINGKGPGDGHPSCGFCRERFYSQEMLSKHCRKSHELCYLCERLGKKNEYYKNYQELEKHFAKDHFVCRERMCVEAKCYAFVDEIELGAHVKSVHPSSRQVKIRVGGGDRENRERSEKRGEERGKASAEERAEQGRDIPEYLNREKLVRERGIKERYMGFLKRYYREHEKLGELTCEYNEERLGLEKYVEEVRGLIGGDRVIDLVERIKSYLSDPKKEEIAKDFPPIRRNIEFAPISGTAKRAEDAKKKNEAGVRGSFSWNSDSIRKALGRGSESVHPISSRAKDKKDRGDGDRGGGERVSRDIGDGKR